MLTLALAATLALVQDSNKPAPTVPAAKIVPVAASAQATQVEEPTLAPGSPAVFPAIEHTIKGDALTAFAPGRVSVVEFGATWCGPCKAGMPHLSDLQKEYKDKGLTVLGISDEPLATVEAFLAKPEWAAKTQYTVCTDPDRSAHDAYMKPAMQNGIPCAFIVKDSVVQWIGHPAQMDTALAQVVDGTFNVAAAKDQFLGTIASKKVTRRLGSMMRDAKTSGNYDEVLKALDEATAKATADGALGFKMQSFQILVGPANQQARGYALGKELVASFTAAKDSMGLNGIAWYVIDNATLTNPDYGFALAAAKEANSITQGKDGAILDTLAAAYWKTGDKVTAIKTQEEAIAATEAGPMRDQMQKVLETYKGTAGNGKVG